MNGSHAYSSINPIALKSPVAPHIAAAEEGRQLSVDILQKACPLEGYAQEYILIEGAGGWLVPLNRTETFADYASAQGLEVILVVGMKLGCINHALLTADNIRARGLKLSGWVANFIDPEMQQQQENLATLAVRLQCPLVAEFPLFAEDNAIESASKYVKLQHLLEN
jgi:dethiobiotin synthetase